MDCVVHTLYHGVGVVELRLSEWVIECYALASACGICENVVDVSESV